MSDNLQKAIQGGKVPESKKSGVLAEALDKVKSVKNQLYRATEMSETLADAVMASAETQATVFTASFAEGYLGEEKMDIGPVDLRLGGGLLVGGYGLYQSMSGKGGSHALAIGNGLLAVGIGRIGRHAGKALAEKKSGTTEPPAQTPAPAAAPPPAQIKGDDIGEIARMVRMTPGTEGEDVAGRRRHREGGRSERFIRERR